MCSHTNTHTHKTIRIVLVDKYVSWHCSAKNESDNASLKAIYGIKSTMPHRWPAVTLQIVPYNNTTITFIWGRKSHGQILQGLNKFKSQYCIIT